MASPQFVFFFQAEDGIRDKLVTGVQTCALPISSSPPWALRAGLQRAEVIHEVPAIRPAHFVPVDRHQPPAHHLATHDHAVEVAVRASSDRVVDEGAHTEEGPPRRRRDRAVAQDRRAVADETVRLIQEPPAVDRLRGARPRIHEPGGLLQAHERVRAGHRYGAGDRRGGLWAWTNDSLET